MIQLAVVAPLLDVGRSLREGLLMFWETLWALVLGFSLSGAVQAFVSKDQMQAKLGSHRPAAVGRAAGYGVVSSSCSYAASAMSKSLFSKGADFVTALVFMVASTNLVVELGIVLLVLLGWQFLAAEFVGGPIMIVLLALGGGLVFSRPLVEAARSRLVKHAAGRGESVADRVVSPRPNERDKSAWSVKLRSPAALSDAAGYAVADAKMLRRELVIGYTVAGLLAVLVPTDAWNALFVHGHGLWTIVENALVGPIIAVASCVCSIGNVPLAAALWFGGISFGGVVSFIFADLIAMPLILIYRKFYGAQLALRVVGLLYAVMVTAGLVTEGIFGLLGAIPTTRTIHATSAQFAWNYTAYLDIVFVGVAGGVWWLAHNRARLGGGHGYVIDPVCGMQVRSVDAPAQAWYDGENYRFCSDRCRERFVASPARYVAGGSHVEEMASDQLAAGSLIGELSAARSVGAIDPICGMRVEIATTSAHRRFEGADYWFCSAGCAAAFDARRPRNVSEAGIPNEPTL